MDQKQQQQQIILFLILKKNGLASDDDDEIHHRVRPKDVRFEEKKQQEGCFFCHEESVCRSRFGGVGNRHAVLHVGAPTRDEG
jgi:hypothetical protein